MNWIIIWNTNQDVCFFSLGYNWRAMNFVNAKLRYFLLFMFPFKLLFRFCFFSVVKPQ